MTISTIIFSSCALLRNDTGLKSFCVDRGYLQSCTK